MCDNLFMFPSLFQVDGHLVQISQILNHAAWHMRLQGFGSQADDVQQYTGSGVSGWNVMPAVPHYQKSRSIFTFLGNATGA
jgi:hypothetical protein